MRTHVSLATVVLLSLCGCSSFRDGDSAGEFHYTTVGADWDGNSDGTRFFFLSGYAYSPARIIGVAHEASGAVSASALVTHLQAEWQDRTGLLPIICASDNTVILFPGENVAGLSIVDTSGEYRIIGSGSVPVGNGLSVRKVFSCP